MADDFKLDVDPSIPTGIDATPDQVAEQVLSGKVPADAIPKLAVEQRPTQDDVDTAVARVPGLTVGAGKAARMTALKKVLRPKGGK